MVAPGIEPPTLRVQVEYLNHYARGVDVSISKCIIGYCILRNQIPSGEFQRRVNNEAFEIFCGILESTVIGTSKIVVLEVAQLHHIRPRAVRWVFLEDQCFSDDPRKTLKPLTETPSPAYYRGENGLIYPHTKTKIKMKKDLKTKRTHNEYYQAILRMYLPCCQQYRSW